MIVIKKTNPLDLIIELNFKENFSEADKYVSALLFIYLCSLLYEINTDFKRYIAYNDNLILWCLELNFDMDYGQFKLINNKFIHELKNKSLIFDENQYNLFVKTIPPHFKISNTVTYTEFINLLKSNISKFYNILEVSRSQEFFS